MNHFTQIPSSSLGLANQLRVACQSFSVTVRGVTNFDQ